MSQPLANPPMIDTNVPTNDNFTTGVLIKSAGDTRKISTRHKYALVADGFLALDNTPAGHGHGLDYGVWGLASTTDQSTNGFPVLRLAFRQQPGEMKGYATQWQVQHQATNSLTPGIALDSEVHGDLVAQRLGNWIYVITSASSRLNSGSNWTTRFKIDRIGPRKTIENRLDRTDSSSPLPGLDGRPYQFFVSDDVSPFVWGTFGDVSDIFNEPTTSDVGSVGNYAFIDDGSGNIGSITVGQPGTGAGWTGLGQLGAYFQPSRPAQPGSYAFGPTLVFPWAAGHHGPPELWYFVMNGVNKKGHPRVTYDIYRAKWARNNYRRPSNLFLADDASFDSGHKRFPALNPHGFAFDPNWHRAANHVSRIGPFDDDIVWNTAIQGLFSPANDGDLWCRYPAFRVLRDTHRVGVLHFIKSNQLGAPYVDDGGVENA